MYELKQTDFKDGTYRIRCPGTYILKEDIIFEPNPDNNYMPKMDNPLYQSRAYTLGFFAAITVECNGVTIDLDGKTIRSSDVFAVAQRFFAVIELGNMPFIPKQGPANFGSNFVGANHCTIKNGIIGRSSHHGIHGNQSDYLKIQNVTIRDFEVAGISVNSTYKCKISDVKIGPGSVKVPVLGNFSAARFMRQFYRLAEMKTEAKLDMTPLLNLENEVKAVFDEVKATGMSTHPLFGNPGGLPDGNNYGILVHVKGIAVNDYIEEDFKEKLSSHVEIDKVLVCDMHIKVNEIVGISKPDGSGVQVDPSGSVIQILEIKAEDDTPIHNALADAQMNLAKFVLDNNITGVGKLNIEQSLVDWYYGNADWNSVISTGSKFKCNGDSMFHVNKGLHGIRVDGVNHLRIKRTHIKRIKNTGLMGDDISCGNYLISHDQQERKGYHGADVSGLHFSFCKNVEVQGIRIVDVESQNGEVRGIRLINQCQQFCINNFDILNLKTGYRYEDGKFIGLNYEGNEQEYDANYPNLVPTSIGIVIDHNSNVKLGDYKIKHLKSPGQPMLICHRAD